MAPGAAGGCEVRGGGGELGSDGGESNPPRRLRSVPSAGAPEPAGAGLALLGFGSDVQFNPFSTDGMLNVQASVRALLPCAQGGGGAAARAPRPAGPPFLALPAGSTAGLGEEQPELAPANPGPPEPHTPPGEGPGFDWAIPTRQTGRWPGRAVPEPPRHRAGLLGALTASTGEQSRKTRKPQRCGVF